MSVASYILTILEASSMSMYLCSCTFQSQQASESFPNIMYDDAGIQHGTFLGQDSPNYLCTCVFLLALRSKRR